MTTEVTAHTRTDVPAHAAERADMSCSDERLRDYHHAQNVKAGEGFPIDMAGGGAALLSRLDRDTALRQWTILFGVDPFEEGTIRLHRHCGYILGLAKDPQEIFSLYDPASARDLYLLGDMAAKLVRDAIYEMYGADVVITVEVIDIITGPDGRPTGQLMPRP